MRIIDWKAVEAFIEERKPVELSAGLLNDWYWTAATVYEEGEWRDKNRAYVSSLWATPGIKATMLNGDVIEKALWRETNEEDEAMLKVRHEKLCEDLKEMAEKLKEQKGASK